MRLPDSAHTSRPWRIHAVTPDFRLEDVWALPAVGDEDEFPRLVGVMASFGPRQSTSLPVRGLFAARAALGTLLRLDRPQSGIGVRVPSLSERLPADLRNGPTGPAAGPFSPLYLTEDEWALELANETMHGVLHLGWVPDGHGAHRGQMAVLVRRNGVLGTAYMAAIAPFRHLLVYPRMLADIGDAWQQATSATCV